MLRRPTQLEQHVVSGQGEAGRLDQLLLEEIELLFLCLDMNLKYDLLHRLVITMKKLPEEISNKLVRAVDDLPHGSGLDVSIDDAAKLSGVPRATLYYYFSGKDDLVQFFLNDLMDRTRIAIEKAAATEGTSEQRLEAIMRALVGAFAEYPRMCLEMPGAFKASDDHAEFLGNVDRSVMGPLRDTLQEGVNAGEFEVPDVEFAAHAITGALHQVSIMRLVLTGSLDADEVSDLVVPQLVQGLLPR